MENGTAPMALAQALTRRMAELELNYKEVAARAGISDVYVSQIARGLKIPKPEVARRLAEVLDLDPYKVLFIRSFAETAEPHFREEIRRAVAGGRDLYDLLRDQGSRPFAARAENLIPLVSRAQCGAWTDFTDLDYPAGVAAEYYPAETNDPNAFYVVAAGDSMVGGTGRGDIHDGDLLLVEPNRRVENGDVVLCRTREGVTVKKYFRNGPDEVVLQPLNHAYPTMVLLASDRDAREAVIFRVSEKRTRL